MRIVAASLLRHPARRFRAIPDGLGNHLLRLYCADQACCVQPAIALKTPPRFPVAAAPQSKQTIWVEGIFFS